MKTFLKELCDIAIGLAMIAGVVIAVVALLGVGEWLGTLSVTERLVYLILAMLPCVMWSGRLR